MAGEAGTERATGRYGTEAVPFCTHASKGHASCGKSFPSLQSSTLSLLTGPLDSKLNEMGVGVADGE